MRRLAALAFPVLASALGAQTEVTVGSKSFPESLVLGEIVAGLIQSTGAEVDHRQGLGGTRVVWEALKSGDVDVYPDYTGTIRQEIFAQKQLATDAEIGAALAEHGIAVTASLGFNNTYAVGVTKELATELGLEKVSDLRAHPKLRFGFSHEFLNRGDGWPSLRDRYRLPQTNVRGIDHALAYDALRTGAIDAMELYSTDAKIRALGLVPLTDDLGHFPKYLAVLLYRKDLDAGVVTALQRLEGRIDEAAMIAMNERAELRKEAASVIAADFVSATFGIRTQGRTRSRLARVAEHTGEHLLLVLASLFLAVIVAVPGGVLAFRRPRLGQGLLGLAGILQTIPSLALLVLLLPLLGLGAAPAIVALFLYSLLPILRNTYTGLATIPAPLRESAEALGLPAGARLRLVELPLAARSILAGIKIAAVINIGTATLGGFVGAGGYGELIFQGLTLQRDDLILEGAVPAALLALAAQGAFELIERRLVPGRRS